MLWYRVSDLDAGRAFYAGKLGFAVDELDANDGWVRLSRGKTVIGLREGPPESDPPVAMVDVEDIVAEADRLREEGIEVGTVFELHGEIRIVDVFDPDGNRVQLSQVLR